VTLFRYSARTADGAARAGEIEAVSAGAVATRLAASGLTPIEIGSASAPSQLWHLPARGVRPEELAVLCRQLYTLSRAGVPLNRALSGLSESARSEELRAALRGVGDGIHAGRDLATALAQYPRVFSRLFVSTIHMGESAGRLEEAFRELGKHIERDHETARKVRAALRYPTLVIGAVVLALAVVNIFVIPTFSAVFAEQGLELPWATRLLLGTSSFFVHGWPYLLAAGIAGGWAFRTWVSTEAGRLRWDELQLRIPVVGSIAQRALLARFARSFAMASRSGVPVIQALRTVAQTLVNAWVEARISAMCDRISRGEPLTASATASGVFPPLLLQMLAVGEESGSVDELLDEAADYYERDVDYDLKRLSELIEPILIVGLGVVVLMLALGVYLPLWDMVSLARSG
jgi:MSHA biogenesis protein MshG